MAAATTQDILAKAGRSGWNVVSVRPEIVKNPMTPAEWTDDPAHRADPYEAQVPTGQFIIQIEPPSGSGQAAQEIKVASANVGGKQYTAEEINNFGDFARKYGRDASQVPMWDANTVVAPDKAGPGATPATTKNVQTYTDPSGTLWERDDATGGWNQAKGVPAGTKAKTPTPLSDYVQVLDPTTGKPIALADPKDPTNRVPINESAKPDRPQIINGAGGSIYSWDGSNLKQLEPGKAEPKEGATRPATNNKGDAIQEVYRGGSWTTDTSVPPKPFGTQPTTMVTAPATEQNLVTQQGGTISTQPNPNYQPTDPVLRAQQLQTQAKAKREDLQQQVLNGEVTSEEAMTQWNDYWNTQVEPIRQEIQQAQQQTQLENQLKVNQDARATDTLAGSTANNLLSQAQTGATTGAGLLQNRVSNAQSMINNVLGIGTGSKNFGIGGGGAPDVSGLPGAVGSYLTNMGGGQGVYDTAVNLVRGIDPNNQSGFAAHAAAALSQVMDRAQQQAAGTYQYGGGMPQPQPVDSTLNKSTYGAFGQAPGAPTTTIAPDGTVTIAHSPAIPDYAAASISDPSRAMG